MAQKIELNRQRALAIRKAKMGNPSESGAAGDVKSSRSAASSKSG